MSSRDVCFDQVCYDVVQCVWTSRWPCDDPADPQCEGDGPVRWLIEQCEGEFGVTLQRGSADNIVDYVLDCRAQNGKCGDEDQMTAKLVCSPDGYLHP